MELDKLALFRGSAPITADDVRALVAEAIPASVWAFTDAVGERRAEAAVDLLDRLLEDTPEPVLLAVLHRRVRELLELGDASAAGNDCRRGQGDGDRQRLPGADPGGTGEGLDDARADRRARWPGRARRDGQGCAGSRPGRGAATPLIQPLG